MMVQEEKKTLGQLLRAAREARGVTREQAAAATRIKGIFLAAMEEDDYHLLPDEHYLVRFVGEYATFLGLDIQDVQRRFVRQIARDRGSLAVFPVKRTVTLSLRRLLPALVLLGFSIPAVFIGLSLLADRPERPGRSEVLKEQPRVKTSSNIEKTVGPVAKAIPAIPDRPTSADAPPATYTLRAKTNEMTWMLVTIDGGETRDVLLRAGETWEWRAQKGFVVTIGNAGGVELTLNGRPLPSLGEPGQVIRDLRVPA
ncbi:MAG: helix-turn-helix domain-containing protein, partial [Candidatus Methylomirabilales bacterium]